MIELPYVLLDVFTDRPFGGNPLAVFPDASGLAPELMQRIAGELSLSESVFVLPGGGGRELRTLRIFTPHVELPFAGHPTVGTAAVLVSEGMVSLDARGRGSFVVREGVGPIEVEVWPDGAGVAARFRSARLPEPVACDLDVADVARVVGLEPREVGDRTSGADGPAAWSCGVPFLFVPVPDRATLARARLSAAAWSAVLAGGPAPHVYLYTRDAEAPGHDVRARMFAPAMGIAEDPATGAAAAALAGILARTAPPDGEATWRIEQGGDMGRPSVIELSAELAAGALRAVRVGGRSVEMGRGMLRLPG